MPTLPRLEGFANLAHDDDTGKGLSQQAVGLVLPG
jgi:hypothetical protein